MQNSSVLLESAGKSDIIFLTDSKEESVGSNMAYLENITKNPAELIRQSYQTLSPVQKRIADLILGEIETVCFLRLDEVSKKADVTTVTVIRFVKKLGYESYGAFKKELQNYVQTMIIPKRIVKAEIQNFREAPASDIIRQDLEKDFKEIIGNRIEKIAPVEYAFQEIDDLPEGFSVPEGRKKPWGTGQAVLAARDVIHEPFLVINADDYYGKEGFKKIHEYMVTEMKEDGDVYDMCMAGFILSNTLSENGGVTRGVCSVDENGTLKTVTETYNIYMDQDGMHASDNDGNPVSVEAGQHVSMNMFGLPASFLKELEQGFPEFLKNIKDGDIKAEYLLPSIIDKCIREKKAAVKVLETRDKWFGVTYKEDKPAVVGSIRKLVEDGVYPEKLFS